MGSKTFTSDHKESDASYGRKTERGGWVIGWSGTGKKRDIILLQKFSPSFQRRRSAGRVCRVV